MHDATNELLPLIRSFRRLLACLGLASLAGLGVPSPVGAASWEGSAALVTGWEVDQGPSRFLELAATGPVGRGELHLDGDLVLQAGGLAGPPALRPIQEGRLALSGPAFRLQILLDRPHLATGDPMALISGSRRGEGQPAFTAEAAGRNWDLSTQVVRRIDNPGPDGDLASLRLQGWWPGARAALTLIRLEEAMLPWPDPEPLERPGFLLQRLASLEGYLSAGRVEVGLQAARSRTADLTDPSSSPLQGRGAGLLRLRTLPWRPSEPLRLEVGIFQTDEGFRSLASRQEALPPGAAGIWAELHRRWPGEGRLTAEGMHARLAAGGLESRGAVEGRLTRWGLGWSAGVEAEAWHGADGRGSEVGARLAVRRSGRWELEVRGGSGAPRVSAWTRPGEGLEVRAGWDAADGGTTRLELRQEGSRGSWRLVWKSRSFREPRRHLFLEAEVPAGERWSWGVQVGRWDRGRYDAVWGWPQRFQVRVGARF